MPVFWLLFIPNPFEGALGAAAPNWKGAAAPVGVEGAGWLAPKVKLKPGAPEVDAAGAGAGAEVAPKLKVEFELGALLKELVVGVVDGVDEAGAPKVKLEVGGVAVEDPNPPDKPVPVDPEAPKAKPDPDVGVDDGAEPNLAGGASALSSADRLPVFTLDPNPVLAPEPKVKPDPLVAGAGDLGGSEDAPKLNPPKPVEARGGVAAALAGGEKRLFGVLFSVAAGVGAPKPGDPPNKDVEAADGAAAVGWPKENCAVFCASSGLGVDEAPNEKDGLAGSSTLAGGAAGVPNEKLAFGGSAAGVEGFDPKSKDGFEASEAGTAVVGGV